MPRPTVQVTGARELRAALKRAGISVQDLKDANAAVGRLVAAASKPSAPRRSGRLAGTVRATKAAGRARVNVGTAGVPYAGPIHWGWPARHISPQPWVATTAQDTQSQWLPLYQEALEQIIATIERDTP
jgi:hypothetical protein